MAREDNNRFKRELFDEDHEAVRNGFRRFLVKEAQPHYEQMERDGIIPHALFEAFGRGRLSVRLNVIRLRLPALRERPEDVPMLTRHFLQQSARQLGVEPKRIADAALARLAQFGFPGNAPAGGLLPSSFSLPCGAAPAR